MFSLRFYSTAENIGGEFTAFGDMIVMFSFIIIQFIILRKHFKSPDA
ncbi:hypothetical protein ABVN80_13190 [Acinetobacter baumannii]